MSTIFLKIRGQSGFAVSSNTGFNLNYIEDFSLPTFSGILYAGDNKSFVGSFDSRTVNLAAVLSDYSIKTDVVQWSQVSGATGSFSYTDKLQTSFTTAAVNTVNVVLRVTITRTTVGGVIVVSDDLQIDSVPTDITSNIAISNNNVINTDHNYFNASWIGSNDQSSEGVTDVIYWRVPKKNGGLLERGTADYIGYKIQKFNETFGQWYDVQTGAAETDIGTYTITDLTGTYRYIPIWSSSGRKIIGNSTKFLKPTLSGVNKFGYGIFEFVKPNFTLNNIGVDNLSATRSATTIENIFATETANPKLISSLSASASFQRSLSTITDILDTDTLSSNTFDNKLTTHSLNVTRIYGASIVELGN